MTTRERAIALLVIQCLLVSSIAAKYLYERKTRPRVWVRAQPYDPSLPMRGRYLALTPLVNACSLPRDSGSAIKSNDDKGREIISSWEWRVRTVARDGKLVAEDARKVLPRSDTQKVWLPADQSCDRVPLTPPVDFFMADTAQTPFRWQGGQELWMEVTVPAAGPPRPIQLAISKNGEWKPLHLD
jgi:hypothetical protein